MKKKSLTLIFLYCLSLMFFSCGEKAPTKSTDQSQNEIFGLATPIVLNHNKTTIITADYFNNTSIIDSLSVHPDFSYDLTADKKEIYIIPLKDKIPLLSEMKVWISGIAYSLLLKKSAKIKHSVTLEDENKQYSKVQLAGEMNNWNPEEGNMFWKEGAWEIELLLNPGNYQYQIVTDGTWVLDPGNPLQADNSIGGINSVLTIAPGEGAPPKLFTDSFAPKSITIRGNYGIDDMFVFWQNTRISPERIKNDEDSYQIEIPKNAEKEKRSFIRIWAYNSSGVSNDIIVPLEYGEVLTNTSSISRDDKEASILYFLLVDRFHNGNKSNDDPIQDSAVDPRANYYGGDLAGINDKIKSGYFTGLGINTLWLSPIVQNPLEAYTEFPAPHRKFSGYHGYWPISSTTVDHRFGTSSELKELIGSSHDGNMNVLMDFVANHVHEKHPLYVAHPEWATNLYLEDSTLNIRIWDEQRLTTWFDTFLPSLDFSNPEVVNAQTDSALFWLENYGLDGFRHDATKHIPEIFWRTLTRKIKDHIANTKGSRFFQIGETFGSRELIGSYVSSGKLDAQFDFNLYFDARSVFAQDNTSFVTLDNSLHESFSYYGNHHLMGNITGNHDIPRFISYAGEAISFTEDAKEAGWSRDVKIKDPVGYIKLSSLTAFIMTIPGVPIIYYGDEIGMVGAGDPDNRRPMKFDDLNENEKKTKTIISKLTKLRNSRLSLIYGDFETIMATEDEYIFVRNYFEEYTIVIFNKSNADKEISFELPQNIDNSKIIVNFNSETNITGKQATVKVAPFSFEILTN